MEKFFKVKEHGSTVRVEVLAGITTFMAMSYILMVNAGMFSALPEVSYNAIYIATALSAVVGTFAMAFLANLPLGLASGMGLNAFFVYTACFNFGLSYANALVLVLLDGIVFIILTYVCTCTFVRYMHACTRGYQKRRHLHKIIIAQVVLAES